MEEQQQQDPAQITEIAWEQEESIPSNAVLPNSIAVGIDENKNDFKSFSSTLTKSRDTFGNRKQILSERLLDALEHIPLTLKLILVVFFAILSLCAFGALLIYQSSQQIASAKQIKHLSEFSVLVSDLVHCLQNERGATTMYMVSNTTLFSKEIEQFQADSDEAIKAFQERKITIESIVVNSSSRFFLDSVRNIGKIQTYIEGLTNWRARIHNFELTVNDAREYYTCWIALMLDTLLILSTQSTDPRFCESQNLVNIMIEMKEVVGIKRAIGSSAFVEGKLSYSNFTYFLQLQYRQSLLLHRFKLQTSTENWLTYERVVANSSSACNVMENYLVNNYQKITQYSAPQWFFNVTLFMNAMREVEITFRAVALSYASDLNRQATGSLVAFTVSTFFVTCLSTCIAIIFSKTIVGPWQRILALQEDTVYKFVPKEFLSILNKDKITDLKYGDYFEMELDVMFVDIRNYTGISENLQTKKIFKLLNKYLKNVGPIIRKHNGYIDKYLGDGFVALFLEPGHAVNAAIEIQNSLKDLNTSLGPKYPTISVGMGLARGLVAVGLVGESRRMDATIISDNVNTAARLESLTKQYHAVILSSKSIIDTTSSVTQDAFRKVGNIALVGKSKALEVIEVIPFDDSPKKITKDLFEKAIDHLYDPQKFNVEQAISLFQQILEIDPQDKLCKIKLELAQSLLQDSSSWTYCDRLTKK